MTDEESPYEEAVRLTWLLRELLDTQPAASGAQVSARLLPVVVALEDALKRWVP